MDMTELSARFNNNVSEAMHDGILRFQKMAGLSTTGEIDENTIIMMNEPRCSNKERMDISTNSQLTNKMRRWINPKIQYQILNLPKSGLSMRIVRENVKKAFRLWEQVANIEATEVPLDYNGEASYNSFIVKIKNIFCVN
jgi:hypothetical protein